MTLDVVLFDLDGTLADNNHRQHFVVGKKKDWDSFFEAQTKDIPNAPIVALFQALQVSERFQILIVTARPERYREVTEHWLNAHGIFFETIFMRADGDRRSDEIIKREILQGLRSEGFNPLFVVDDRKTVVQMWRDEGVVCLQCADHNF